MVWTTLWRDQRRAVARDDREVDERRADGGRELGERLVERTHPHDEVAGDDVVKALVADAVEALTGAQVDRGDERTHEGNAVGQRLAVALHHPLENHHRQGRRLPRGPHEERSILCADLHGLPGTGLGRPLVEGEKGHVQGHPSTYVGSVGAGAFTSTRGGGFDSS